MPTSSLVFNIHTNSLPLVALPIELTLSLATDALVPLHRLVSLKLDSPSCTKDYLVTAGSALTCFPYRHVTQIPELEQYY